MDFTLTLYGMKGCKWEGNLKQFWRYQYQVADNLAALQQRMGLSRFKEGKLSHYHCSPQ